MHEDRRDASEVVRPLAAEESPCEKADHRENGGNDREEEQRFPDGHVHGENSIPATTTERQLCSRLLSGHRSLHTTRGTALPPPGSTRVVVVASTSAQLNSRTVVVVAGRFVSEGSTTSPSPLHAARLRVATASVATSRSFGTTG